MQLFLAQVNMRLPIAFLGLSTQLLLQNPINRQSDLMAGKDAEFAFKEGPDIFSPKDLVELIVFERWAQAFTILSDRTWKARFWRC